MRAKAKGGEDNERNDLQADAVNSLPKNDNSHALKKDVFELAHDRQYHGDYHRIYERLLFSIYMRRLTKYLRIYIQRFLTAKSTPSL